VFDPKKITSDSDWARAGKTVFEASTDFAPAETIHNRAWFLKIRPPIAKDGIMPAYRYVVRKRGIVEVGSGSCAMCHSRVLPDETYIEGAQGNFPVEQVFAEQLRRQHSQRISPLLAIDLLLPPRQVAQFTGHL
jgi:hypothetical protein